MHDQRDQSEKVNSLCHGFQERLVSPVQKSFQAELIRPEKDLLALVRHWETRIRLNNSRISNSGSEVYFKFRQGGSSFKQNILIPRGIKF